MIFTVAGIRSPWPPIWYPQPEAQPEQYVNLDFRHFFMQPLDDPERDLNTKLTLQYVLAHPQWRISLQLHKILGVR